MFNKKFLFIGFNNVYVNPYCNMVLKTLGSLVDLEYFGPGYVSSAELEIGIEEWLSSRKPHDYIICDVNVVLKKYLSRVKGLFSMSVLKFDENLYYKHVDEYYHFFRNSSLKKIIIANWDPYVISNDDINYITSTNSYIIDFFGLSLSKEYTSLKEKRFKLHTNYWVKFLKDFYNKTIVYPHAISNSDFEFSLLKGRRHVFSVVGVNYSERRESKKITSLELKILDFKTRLRMLIWNKFKFEMNVERMNRYKSSYNKIISESKFCYCSGSELGYPVRKYFEIPARGTVPIGKKCNGFEHLGFKDNENFIVAENIDELKKKLKFIDDDQAQKISLNAYKNIWLNHSEWSRKEQMKEVFNLIFNENFEGSQWINGKFKTFKNDK